MPLGAIGGVTEATITKTDAETMVAHGSGPMLQSQGIPRSPGQPAVQQAAPVNGESTDNEPPPGDEPTFILGGDDGSENGGSGDGGAGDGDQTITVTTGQGSGIGGKIGNTQFLGNAALIAPATLVNLGNTIWGDIRPQA